MKRSHLAALALSLALAAPVMAAEAPSLPPATLADLVAANHILVDRGVVDVRGHVSLRDPTDPNRFWITRAVAPGLAVASDFQAFDLDGNQVGGAAGTAYTERFIHARIYKARPDVKAVVHAHTQSLITMSMSGIPIRVVGAAAIFAARRGVPVHVNGASGEGIHDIEHGDQLARTLGDAEAVLMQGHGVVVVGRDLKTAVGRTVGLDINTRMLIDLLAIGAKPVVLRPSDAPESDYAREWSWWTFLARPKPGADR